VGQKRDLLSESLAADQINCLVDAFPEEAWAKIRYAHRAARCRISRNGDRLAVRFEKPQEAVSPGQSVVLYDDTTVLGGGIIQEVDRGAH
jgi:tRNA-specific 2-thiouridylase